jgi:hypothetical protein
MLKKQIVPASLVVTEWTIGIHTQNIKLTDLADEFYCQKVGSM